jgi:hypothetical protein
VPHSRGGFALVTVMVLVGLLSVVAITVNRVGGMQSKIVQNLGGNPERGEQAYCVAQAGLEHALFVLFNVPGHLPGAYSVDVSLDAPKGLMKIAATGKVGSDERTIDYTVPLFNDRFVAKDTYITDDKQSANFGGLDYMNIGSTGNLFRGLLEIDTSVIPVDARIILATLDLHLYDRSTGNGKIDIAAHRITRDWKAGTKLDAGQPNGATWKSANGGNKAADLWGTVGGDFDPSAEGITAVQYTDGNGWYSWEVTGLVNSWFDGTYPNYGVLMKETAENNSFYGIFYSGNTATKDLRPKLNVYYVIQ